MDISKLKGAEILHRHNLANKMLIEIPNTKAHLLLDFHGEGINAYVLELGSTKRCILGKNLSQEIIEKVVTKAMENENTIFKDCTLKKLTTHLINIINET